MMIVTNESLPGASHTTNNPGEGASLCGDRPMKTTSSAGSTHVPSVQRSSRGSPASGQWWKAWVLLTSVGATVLGWMAFTTGEPPVESVVIAPVARPMPIDVAPALGGSGLDEPRPLLRSARTLPAMPQKPIFQAPVTRTRRS
jgi:hypothetical protein